MRRNFTLNALAVAAALVALGAGCAGLFRSKADVAPAPEPSSVPQADSAPEQADLIVEEAVRAMADEEAAEASAEADAEIFFSDEEELLQFENSYDENQL